MTHAERHSNSFFPTFRWINVCVCVSWSQPNWMYYLEHKDLLLTKFWRLNCISLAIQPSHLKLHHSCVRYVIWKYLLVHKRFERHLLPALTMAATNQKYTFIHTTKEGVMNRSKHTKHTIPTKIEEYQINEKKSAHNKHKYKITDEFSYHGWCSVLDFEHIDKRTTENLFKISQPSSNKKRHNAKKRARKKETERERKK